MKPTDRSHQIVELFDCYAERLYSYFMYQSGGDQRVAERLTEQTFGRAAAQMAPAGQPTAVWLYRIAHQLWLEQSSSLASAADGASAGLFGGLQALPAQLRSVLTVRLLLGFSVADAGYVLRMGELDVRKLEPFALRSLAAAMAASIA